MSAVVVATASVVRYVRISRLSAANSRAMSHKSTQPSAPPSQSPMDAHPQRHPPDSPPPIALSPYLPLASKTPGLLPAARPILDAPSHLQRKPPKACPGWPVPALQDLWAAGANAARLPVSRPRHWPPAASLCSAGATAGAVVGATSSPLSSRSCARSRSRTSTTAMAIELLAVR